jgi:hypothetical protein
MVSLPHLCSTIALDHRPANDTTRTHPLAPPAATAARPSGVRRVFLALEVESRRGREVMAIHHLLEGARATMGSGPGVLVFADTEETVLAEVDGGEFVVHVPPGGRARAHRRAGPAELAGPGRRILLRPGDRVVVALGAAVTVHARVVAVERYVPLELVAAERRSARRTLLAATVYLAVLVAAVAIGRPAAAERAASAHAATSAVALATPK